ncbi:MAG: M81 family metallopeptidase [Planctomyces sp.]
MVRRVLTGGISHETSTFTPVETTLESFRERGLLRGEELIQTLRGTNTTIGGFINGAERYQFELVPTLYAEAQTSAPATRNVFDQLLNEMLERMSKAGAADAVLLALHGSMCVGNLDGPDGLHDADGEILSRVRALVGPDVPILAELDIHSNMTPLMISKADVLIGRRSYPEVDMSERALECTEVLQRIWNDSVRPTMALRQIPMVWGMNQVTAHAPMSLAMAELEKIRQTPGVLAASIATCYFLADVPDMGASVYVVTDNDQRAAQRYADELGDWCWQRRYDWHFHMPSTRDAIERARRDGKFPVIFADMRDNPGGGSPGDSTGMLRAFMEAGLRDACILNITDPETALQCHAAGVGSVINVLVGGKSSPLQGDPVPMRATVKAVSDGVAPYDGPMFAGLSTSLGPSAHIESNGIHIVVTTLREQPFDTAFARSLKLNPAEMKWIGVKSAAHFRAGFESWSKAIHVVSEPGVHNLGHLPFRRLKQTVFPLGNMNELEIALRQRAEE